MSEDEAQKILDDINLTPEWQRKPTAETLGQRLQLTYAERSRLFLRTIGPCDMTEAGMALIRKQKKRQQDKLRRQRQPRAEYLAASVAQTKPWIAAGFNTRRTWERNGKPIVASMHHIKLIQTDRTLATQEKTDTGLPRAEHWPREEHCTDAGLCDRLSTATPAWQVQTCADGFLTADEAAWLVDAIRRPNIIPLEQVA